MIDHIDIKKGEHIAIVGPNGGGKSMLVSKIKSDEMKHIGFRDTYGSETIHDIVKFLAGIHPSSIPWKRYTVS